MPKSSPINMRVEPAQHALLTKAAAILHKDRTAFILDVACREAENVLLDQRIFQLEEDQYQQFESALSEPIPQNQKLKDLLKEAAPWEE